MTARDDLYSRRNVVTGAAFAGATLLLGQNAWSAAAKTETPEQSEISVPEDLMRQHAIAGRLLVIYGLATNPQGGVTPPSTKALASTAQMLRSTVDDFHARLEEDYVFPMFQKANKMVDLVTVLHEQHMAARRLTDSILRATERAEGPASESLMRDLQNYARMIQAHTAYEETILYPQIRTVVSASEYNQLAKTLQDADRRKLGAEGFSGLVAKVADLERQAGIRGLAQFTPGMPREQTAMGNPTK